MTTRMKVAAAVTAALVGGYAQVASADITAFAPAGYAEGKLMVSNFNIIGDDGAGNTFTIADLLAGGGSPLSGTISNLEASVTSRIEASINGVPGAPVGGASQIIDPLSPVDPGPPPVYPTITHQVTRGDSTGWTPYSSLTVGNLYDNTFAAAVSDHEGDGAGVSGTSTTAQTQAVTNLRTVGQGAAGSDQALSTEFSFTLASGLFFTVSFDAEAYGRIALAQDGLASEVNIDWTLQVTREGAPLGEASFLTWAPDGQVGGPGNSLSGGCLIAAVCQELSDPETLQIAGTLLDAGDTDLATGGTYSIRTFLPAGNYTLLVNHVTSVSTTVVPEPGVLALMGVGVLGLGAAARARRARQG